MTQEPTPSKTEMLRDLNLPHDECSRHNEIRIQSTRRDALAWCNGFAKFEPFSQRRDNAAKSRTVTEKNRDAERFVSDNPLSDVLML